MQKPDIFPSLFPSTILERQNELLREMQFALKFEFNNLELENNHFE